MSMNDMSIRTFAEALSAKSPVPGGGSVAALVGALGIALGSMVGNFTLGKEQHADVEPDILRILEEADNIRLSLLSCVDEDVTAFEPLSNAYGIPKDDPGRAEILEKCFREAASVPMKILGLACRAIELHSELAEKVSGSIVSDVGSGVVFCWAALYGSALNVKVNTKLMTDRAYAEELNARVDALMDKYWKIADSVYESVYGRFC